MLSLRLVMQCAILPSKRRVDAVVSAEEWKEVHHVITCKIFQKHAHTYAFTKARLPGHVHTLELVARAYCTSVRALVAEAPRSASSTRSQQPTNDERLLVRTCKKSKEEESLQANCTIVFRVS